MEDGLSLSALIQGKKVKLYEEVLGKILDIPINGAKFVKNQQPLVEFMQNTSNMGGISIAGVRKKFLKNEFC